MVTTPTAADLELVPRNQFEADLDRLMKHHNVPVCVVCYVLPGELSLAGFGLSDKAKRAAKVIHEELYKNLPTAKRLVDQMMLTE